ncbi:hypothetical protein B0T11DRAFT_309375 [Plectosphaerella cucumerina]|uniref:Glucose-methanol-choline oxidoreductase N-terminal domain-containing protein n=1 Tax=Plectosphaerella cucumerina TaxID=40658 RepID=A0A8K0TV25_9PEZI|nr:hypothetical protein B0T11DRAFT_309375 [Plectosphaerella cucumerina]
MAATDIIWDYVVVGAGVAGSVLASRLRQYDQSLNILLLEAGSDTRSREDILYANANPVGGDLDWNFKTEPIPGFQNRETVIGQGKGLGGSAAINMAGWVRGSAHEYDDWADMVGDDRWRFNNQLPYMKMSETWPTKENSDVHGYSGPIQVATSKSTGRDFPLRDALAQKGLESIGIKPLPHLDGFSGDNLGYATSVEARVVGKRQIPTAAYPMDGVTILVDTLVEKILSEPGVNGTGLRATGVLLASGEEVKAKNVISCAGAFQSPKLLMLSGIGAKKELEAHDIEVKVDLPEVGKNLGDHLVFFQFWKLRNPEKGYALGSSNPLFQQPQFGMGIPIDWVTCATVGKEKLSEAISKDEGATPTASHRLLKHDRSFNELLVIYLAFSPANPVIPMDGSHLNTAVISLLPTSRGSIGLRSAKASDPPVISPNYLDTEVDRYVYRDGLRSMAKLMLDTEFGKEYIEGETAPDNVDPIRLDSSDEYLDERIANGAVTSWHPHGGCSMGKVVDSGLKVSGFENLYVVDSSVIPVALSTHLMAPVYALAEQAAAILSGKEQ